MDGDVRHRRGRRSAVPVLLPGCDAHDVARPDLLHRTAPPLHPAETGGHNQRLTERVRVPCGTGAWLERDARSVRPRRRNRVEQWIDADCSGEPIRRALHRRLGPASLDFHVASSPLTPRADERHRHRSDGGPQGGSPRVSTVPHSVAIRGCSLCDEPCHKQDSLHAQRGSLSNTSFASGHGHAHASARSWGPAGLNNPHLVLLPNFPLRVRVHRGATSE